MPRGTIAGLVAAIWSSGCGPQALIITAENLPVGDFRVGLIIEEAGTPVFSTGLYMMGGESDVLEFAHESVDSGTARLFAFDARELGELEPDEAVLEESRIAVRTAKDIAIPGLVWAGSGAVDSGRATIAEEQFDGALTAAWIRGDCPQLIDPDGGDLVLSQNCSVGVCDAEIFQDQCAIRILSQSCDLDDLTGSVDQQGRVAVADSGIIKDCSPLEVEEAVPAILSTQCKTEDPLREECRLDVFQGSFPEPFEALERELTPTSGVVVDLFPNPEGLLVLVRTDAPDPSELFLLDSETLMPVRSSTVPSEAVGLTGLSNGDSIVVSKEGSGVALSRHTSGGVTQRVAVTHPSIEERAVFSNIIATSDPQRIVLSLAWHVPAPQISFTRIVAIDPQTLQVTSVSGMIDDLEPYIVPTGRDTVLVREDRQFLLIDLSTGARLAVYSGLPRALATKPAFNGMSYTPGFFMASALKPLFSVIIYPEDNPEDARLAKFGRWFSEPNQVLGLRNGLALVALRENGHWVALLDPKTTRFLPGATELESGDQLRDLVEDDEGRVFALFTNTNRILRLAP